MTHFFAELALTHDSLRHDPLLPQFVYLNFKSTRRNHSQCSSNQREWTCTDFSLKTLDNIGQKYTFSEKKTKKWTWPALELYRAHLFNTDVVLLSHFSQLTLLLTCISSNFPLSENIANTSYRKAKTIYMYSRHSREGTFQNQNLRLEYEI